MHRFERHQSTGSWINEAVDPQLRIQRAFGLKRVRMHAVIDWIGFGARRACGAAQVVDFESDTVGATQTAHVQGTRCNQTLDPGRSQLDPDTEPCPTHQKRPLGPHLPVASEPHPESYSRKPRSRPYALNPEPWP